MASVDLDKQVLPYTKFQRLLCRPYWKIGVGIAFLLAVWFVVLIGLSLDKSHQVISIDAKTKINSEEVSPISLVYQSEDSEEPLIDAQALLTLLQLDKQWVSYVSSRKELHFCNRNTNETLYIFDGWKDMQIYYPKKGICIYSAKSAAVISEKKAYIPLSFVNAWLDIEAKYIQETRLLQLNSISKISEKEVSESVSTTRNLSTTSSDISHDAATTTSSIPLSEKETLSSEQKLSESFPERIDLSYIYLDIDGTSHERKVYAYLDNGNYGFANIDGTPLTVPYYPRIGSPSQSDFIVYQGVDGQIVGVVAGWYRPDHSVLYGVLSLEQMKWVVPCRYQDIYLEGNKCYGVMDGAGVQLIGEVKL